MLPEKLRAQLTALALIYDITPRGVNPIHLVSKIKKKSPKKEDEAVLRQVCKFYSVEYERLPTGGGE